MKLKSLFLFSLFLVSIVLLPEKAQAQLLDNEQFSDVNTGEPPPDEIENPLRDNGLDEDFTGTLSDEDPDSEVYKENELFGSEEETDESLESDDSEESNNRPRRPRRPRPSGTVNDGEESDDPNAEVEEEEDLDATHLLTFEFNSQVLMTNTQTEQTFLEINYTTRIEKEIQIKKSRYRTTGKATIVNEVIGDLAGNELFGCKLRIETDDIRADIMSRFNQRDETEEEEAISELALQIKFKKSAMLENWFSDCTGTDGSLFNTAGDKEKYLYMTLEAITPELTGFTIPDYIRSDEGVIELVAEPFIIEYPDSSEIYTLQGNGQVTIVPLDDYIPTDEE